MTRRLSIWQVGSHAIPEAVSGLNYVVWSLAESLAARGHRVTMLFDTPPTPATTKRCSELGLTAVDVSSLSRLTDVIWRLRTFRPDIAHFHSVFRPTQAALAWGLDKFAVPQVISPHGGLHPIALRRGRLKKAPYSQVIERRRYRLAAAVGAVSSAEIEQVIAFAGIDRRRVHCIYNPVADPCAGHEISPISTPNAAKKVVSLGRFDVEHKGLDLLASVARQMPTVQFELYGNNVQRRSSFQSLLGSLPANVSLCPPVFGTAKAELLCRADAYIQTSRWEAFGISMAEAMFCKLPVLLSDRCDLAPLVQTLDLGSVFEFNTSSVVAALAKALDRPASTINQIHRAKEFADANLTTHSYTTRCIDLYQQVLQAMARPSGQ